MNGDEIRESSRNDNNLYGGAVAELKNSFGNDLDLVFTHDAEGAAAGPLRHSAFLKIANNFLQPLKKYTGELDGVYFSMHGAMGTDVISDPEGYLLEESRKILGDKIPIVISMDLHGILTKTMLRNIDGVAAYHTYPHIDFDDTGRRAAKILVSIIKYGAKPIAARIRIPTLVRGNELVTESGAFGKQSRRFLPTLRGDRAG